MQTSDCVAAVVPVDAVHSDLLRMGAASEGREIVDADTEERDYPTVAVDVGDVVVAADVVLVWREAFGRAVRSVGEGWALIHCPVS